MDIHSMLQIEGGRKGDLVVYGSLKRGLYMRK